MKWNFDFNNVVALMCICDIKTREVTLPSWLDKFIFTDLGAYYCRSNSDMLVIDWTPDQILGYLGTYFPRSYTEAYCIFKQYLQTETWFDSKDTLDLLDFGCGTGGEIIGLATAIAEVKPNVKHLRVKAIDGNQYALNRFCDVKNEFNKHHNLQIVSEPSAIEIDDFYDLSILDSVLDTNYDIVISFKAVCEFVTKQQFEKKNAYEHLAKFMLPKMLESGVMLLVDVTTKNCVVQEWLPDLMDSGLKNAEASVFGRNPHNNVSFVVNHSRQRGDISKVAWRLVSR